MQMGKSIDLLPHVICLKFLAQISNSKLKCNCILVVHNDHMYDLVNMGVWLMCPNVGLVDLVLLTHISTRRWVFKKKPFPF
jgi:hypothetical protein